MRYCFARFMRRKLGRLAAWLVTAGMLVYLFSRVPFHEVLEKVGQAAPWLVPAMVAIILAVYVADTFAIWKTFGWFVTPMRFPETLALRGATFLLALVNYALGQGALIYFLHRTRGVKLMRAAAAVLLIMGINLLLLLLLTSLGLVLGAGALPELRTIVLIGYLGLVVYVVALAVRPAWLTSRPILDVLLNAGLVGHLKCMAVRLPHIITLLVLNHVALLAFGVHVPLLQSVLCIPVVLLVAVLPISVQGLGPTQGAMLVFFTRFAQGSTQPEREATILAASLSVQAIASVVQITIGALCIRSQVGRRLKDVSREVPRDGAMSVKENGPES
jgi:hypothetical protein